MSATRAAGVFLTDGRAVLLLKRAADDEHHPNQWGLPGGKMKTGEGWLAGAKRELKEEAGRVPAFERLGQFDSSGEHGLRFRTFVCRVGKRFKPVLSDEHDAGRWVGLGEVERLDLHPKFRDALPHLMKMVDGPVQESAGFAEFLEETDG